MPGRAASGSETRPTDVTLGPPSLHGLTATEAAHRLAAGDGNRPSSESTRTTWQIVRANVFTRFNAILGLLLAVILVLGPLADGLFGIILVANALIGIVQEVRAKRTLDHLALIVASPVTVLRDDKEVAVNPFAVVRGDLIRLSAGVQIVADGPVEASEGLEIDESLLTGEADPCAKSIGDPLRSGSFVNAGTGWFRAEEVGDNSYANALSAQVHKFNPVKSELRAATDAVLRLVTWAIGPIAAALLVGQHLGGESWRKALFGAATGVIEIVPEGFVLLTSLTLAMSVVRLGRMGVLVKELAAVEGLARVDTLCFDKTGTLTEGRPTVEAVIPLQDEPITSIDEALRALTKGGANATASAIQAALADKSPTTAVTGRLVPFSSARKWAAITETGTSDASTWVMGAPEIVISDEGSAATKALLQDIATRTASGKRVLLLAKSRTDLSSDALPLDLRPVAIIVLAEQIRKDAVRTIRYFAGQNVDVKIISGDNPATVGAIARAAGMAGLVEPTSVIDARTLDNADALAAAIGSAEVIGRTTPQQKKLMVEALQAKGRTVAMTGDGVNDALALKVADLAIAMGSGSDATKAVAQLVLVEGGFAALPGVVDEGRRVIANVERVAKLFITKTVYAAALAIASGVARLPFPFLPRQLTLVSSLTIGVPGFFLAFASASPRTEAGLLRRLAIFAFPAGLVAATATFSTYALVLFRHDVPVEQARTCTTVVLGVIGLWVVDVLCRPLSRWREALLLTLAAIGLGNTLVAPMRRFWDLDFPRPVIVVEALIIAGIAIAVIEAGWRIGRSLNAAQHELFIA